MSRKQPGAGQTESQLADIDVAITRTGPKTGAKGRKALCGFKCLQVWLGKVEAAQMKSTLQNVTKQYAKFQNHDREGQ